MTTKERVQEIIAKMPNESTIEDIQYYLYVLKCIEDGEKDIENGSYLTHEEVESRLAEWLK